MQYNTKVLEIKCQLETNNIKQAGGGGGEGKEEHYVAISSLTGSCILLLIVDLGSIIIIFDSFCHICCHMMSLQKLHHIRQPIRLMEIPG
jgi:hypothetical protein